LIHGSLTSGVSKKKLKRTIFKNYADMIEKLHNVGQRLLIVTGKEWSDG
jgi:hypothetical protein